MRAGATEARTGTRHGTSRRGANLAPTFGAAMLPLQRVERRGPAGYCSGMKGRWGLQAKMTATYVAVTAGAVLLTELVIFGAAALSPPTPLTGQELLTRTQETAQGQAAKLAVTIAKAGRLPSTTLGLPGTPVTPGQAQPDGSGGLAVPQTSAPVCDLAPASFAEI